MEMHQVGGRAQFMTDGDNAFQRMNRVEENSPTRMWVQDFQQKSWYTLWGKEIHVPTDKSEVLRCTQTISNYRMKSTFLTSG